MGQISVLTGPERRRRWSEDERCRIVAEAFAPGSCVAQVARDHDISTGLIYTWRHRLRQDLADQGFVEAAMEYKMRSADRIEQCLGLEAKRKTSARTEYFAF